ncbi:MAG: hypothetical protein LC780_04590 [Acidobacteria bacterium]|nr:hypothetical protein [Acidobacteriota bacterium]
MHASMAASMPAPGPPPSSSAKPARSPSTAKRLAALTSRNAGASRTPNATGTAVRRSKKKWYVSGAPAKDSFCAGKLSPNAKFWTMGACTFRSQ